MASRFAKLQEHELDDLDGEKYSKNTKRVIKHSVHLFREFLGGQELDTEFESLPKEDLNKHLRSFFACIRKADGTELKKSSLVSIKYGICKFLKDNCDIDVYNDNVFSLCLSTFKSKVTDLKKRGKGSIQHKEEISPDDLKRLFSSENIAFNVDTPSGLQKKVWFDLMYFLCRRGQENLREMKKDTFAVATNAAGRKYAYQRIDEADKNHGGEASFDETVGEGRMFAIPDDRRCPVASFEKYIEKLNPDIDCLWQRPLESFDSDANIWYCMAPVGKSKLASMMGEISKLASLSKHYTNHCIRATTISELDRGGIEARHLVRVSGHKSEMSIRSYSRRLCEQKQEQISDTLAKALQERQPPTTSSQQVEPKQQFQATINQASVGNDSATASDLDLDLIEEIFRDDNVFVEIGDFGKENVAPENLQPSILNPIVTQGNTGQQNVVTHENPAFQPGPPAAAASAINNVFQQVQNHVGTMNTLMSAPQNSQLDEAKPPMINISNCGHGK